MATKNVWTVQTGKGRAAYNKTWTFTKFSSAIRYYYGLNIHSGYKKRILHNGVVIDRYLS